MSKKSVLQTIAWIMVGYGYFGLMLDGLLFASNTGKIMVDLIIATFGTGITIAYYIEEK